MATIQEIHEQQRKNHFSFCNIDKYHEAGYKGKDINILNLDANEHGIKINNVFSDVVPEATIYLGSLSGTTDGTYFDFMFEDKKQDFETFVAEHNIKLINCSIGGYSKLKNDFMKKYIIDKYNIILTNAAGNNSGSVSAAFRDVAIVVGALNYNDGNPVLANYSNYGEKITFVSFAHLYAGTSFAAPFLLGKIALLLSKYGDFTQKECVEILKSISLDLGDKDKYGWGIPVLPLADKLEILEKLRGGNMDFKDVEQDRWSKPAIDYCVEQGTLQGFPDGTFKPAEPMTREQYAQAEYNKAKREGRI